MYTILLIGTEWFSKKGGLSTFNRLLCKKLAVHCKVFCYVPTYEEDEFRDAANHDVTLVKPKIIAGLEPMVAMINKPLLPADENIDVIIGHDRISGPIMEAIWNNYYRTAKKVFFIHTCPSEIEWLKPEQQGNNPAARGEEREIIQKELAKNSTLVVAVGPKLFLDISMTMAGLLTKPKIIRFDPGLYHPVDEINYQFDAPVPETLMMGRLEDFHLKGVDIAFRAMDLVYRSWEKVTNNIVIKPKMIIRGAAIGGEKDLKLKFRELIPDSRLNPLIRNYSSDIEVINEDIRRSSVVLMPSRSEGFGLVGLEAMSLGKPILISENSGLAMLLTELDPTNALNWIISSDSLDEGVQEMSEKIHLILDDRIAAGKKLKDLVSYYDSKINWDKSVAFLISEINKQERPQNDIIQNKSSVTGSNAIDQVSNQSTVIDNNQEVIQMQLGTKLVDTYRKLPVTKRFKIADELGVIEPGETLESHNSDILTSKFLERILTRNLLDQLWNKLFNETENPNPFKK